MVSAVGNMYIDNTYYTFNTKIDRSGVKQKFNVEGELYSEDDGMTY